MVFISKNDKKAWQDYIDNFEHFTLNLKKDVLKKEVKINEKNSITKNNIANSYKLFKKGKIKPDGVIDLHGYSLKVGKQNLESYILKSYENNLRNILVITGKGLNNQGALKKEVPVWLEEKKIKNYLISFEKAPNNNGGSGALLLRIKNKYKFKSSEDLITLPQIISYNKSIVSASYNPEGKDPLLSIITVWSFH